MRSRQLLSLLICLFLPVIVFAASDGDDLIAAARKSDVAKVKELLAKGVNVNSKTEYGATALSYAAARGNVEIVKMLVEAGAEVNVSDTFYRATPLDWASGNGHAEIVKMLLDKGASDIEGALSNGIFANSVDVVKVVLAKGGLRPAALTGAWFNAEQQGAAEIIDLLKAAGAQPPPKADFRVDEETLKSYVGAYRTEQPPGEFVVALTNGKLTVKTTNGQLYELGPTDKVTFVTTQFFGVTVAFKADNGKVTGFTWKQNDRNIEFKKVEQ